MNVGYNVQASSDSKHKFLTGFNTGSVNDTHALADIAIETMELLRVEKINVLADEYLYSITAFVYDHARDLYICPQGEEMTTNNRWHTHSQKRKGKKGAFRFRRYNTPSCRDCEKRNLCTQSNTNGRYIDRSEYAYAVEENAKRVHQNPDYYRKRQQITEHMFGTLKRQRGFTFTLLRGKEKVLGEVGLMFIGYNLSRGVSVIGAEKLIKALKECCLPFLSTFSKLPQATFACFKHIIKKYSLNGLQFMTYFCAIKPARIHYTELSLQ